MNYPYTAGDLISSPQNYQFTPYAGAAFVEAWCKSRRAVIAELAYAQLPELICMETASATNTVQLLRHICLWLRQSNGERTDSSLVQYWLPRLLKKFEVSKRLYAGYRLDPPHPPVPDSGYFALEPYLLLAEALCHAWRNHAAGYYLSALLKINDTLISQRARLTPIQQSHLAWLLEAELDAVRNLRVKVGL